MNYENEKRLRKMLRRVKELDAQERRIEKHLTAQHFEKPSVRRRLKASMARWRAKVNPRDREMRALDGTIYRDGETLIPRKQGKTGDFASRKNSRDFA